MGDAPGDTREDTGALEPLEDVPDMLAGTTEMEAFPELTPWRTTYLTNSLPSLFLDRSLRIVRANASFCRLFACADDLTGTYFTRFHAASFDEARSSELFRAVLSPATRFEWCGRLERVAKDQLLNVSKVWIQPLGASDGPPRAYCALYLDMTAEHVELLNSTFRSLLGAARLKDNDTGNHIERVNRYSRVLAEGLAGQPGFSEVDRVFLETIGQVAALHDVGKIGTPDDILNKAGPLDPWERDIMRQHTINGAYILSTFPQPMAREIALHHHERWDGTGYPHGLMQDLIPLSARIVAVADVYDALRMRRAYKEPMTHERARDTIAAESGTHFDPRITERFVAMSDRFERTFADLADDAAAGTTPTRGP